MHVDTDSFLRMIRDAYIWHHDNLADFKDCIILRGKNKKKLYFGQKTQEINHLNDANNFNTITH